MFKRIPTEIVNWIIIIGVILLVIEIAFFHGGLIFGAIIGAVFVYYGWKYFTTTIGKILFVVGAIILIVSVLNMLAVRFLILAAIVLFVIHYIKANETAKKVRANLLVIDEHRPEKISKIEPFLDQKLWNEPFINDDIYAWRDINIQGLYGDRIIDLSNTVLPNDTAIISIRQIFGNLTIYVPYEIEVSVHLSILYGKTTIFGNNQEQLLNQSNIYQTDNYDNASQRVKIICTLLSGDIEVKRI